MTISKNHERCVLYILRAFLRAESCRSVTGSVVLRVVHNCGLRGTWVVLVPWWYQGGGTGGILVLVRHWRGGGWYRGRIRVVVLVHDYWALVLWWCPTSMLILVQEHVGIVLVQDGMMLDTLAQSVRDRLQ